MILRVIEIFLDNKSSFFFLWREGFGVKGIYKILD